VTWEPEVNEIERRRELARRMGGVDRVEQHHARGEFTVRERIERLVDPDSFREIGVLAGTVEYDEAGNVIEMIPANAVAGTATIEGRHVLVGGEDATIRGGSYEGGGSAKLLYMEHLARQMRLPMIRLQEGAGGSVTTNRAIHSQQQLKGVPLSPFADLLGTVPVVGAAMGACAGISAANLALTHLSIMVKDAAFLFAGGPPVVERALGRAVDKEELGGWRVAAFSGLIDNVAEDEEDCLAQIRAFLGYLPSNVWELPPRGAVTDDAERRDQELLSVIPRDRRRAFDPGKIIRAVLDRDSFFEMTPYFGRSIMTGLARLDGYPVGVIANNPNVNGGAMDHTAAEKITRFIDLCDTFHLPIIGFQDEPGFMVGVEAERAGTLRKGVRALAAASQSTVPWCKFIVRRAYGVAARVHHNDRGPAYAWPSGEWGSLPVEGGVWAAHRREIEAAADPEQRRIELEQLYEAQRSPFFRAEAFGLTDLIDPRDSRPLAVEFARAAQTQLRTSLGQKTRVMRP
jgi:acetyl-CoA carboxylase carboxyltransferase component